MNTRFTSSPTGLASHTHTLTHTFTREQHAVQNSAGGCQDTVGLVMLFAGLSGRRGGEKIGMEAQTGWLRQGLGSRRKSSVWVPLTLVVRRCSASLRPGSVSTSSTDAARTALPPPLGFSEPLLSRSLCFGPLHTSLFLSCISNIVVSPVWAAHASLSISF